MSLPTCNLPSFNLQGRRALVTGASAGLGLHFAQVLAGAGAGVVLAARRADKISAEAAALNAAGMSAHCVEMDVTDAASVKNAFACAAQLLGGPVDILVNNAGVSGDNFFLNTSEQEWDFVLDTNLKGPFLVAREMANALVAAEKPGSIINIASILGFRVAAVLAPYCASKAGLVHLTKSMAFELARHNIRVNAIAPGYVETDINSGFFDTEPGKKMLARIPMRRLGEKEELSGPLLLLASDAGAYMTGAVLEVDGGHLCSSL